MYIVVVVRIVVPVWVCLLDPSTTQVPNSYGTSAQPVPHIPFMPPPLRVFTSVPRHALGRRYASHGAPHYNEPTGWLFGEKVTVFHTHAIR